MNVLFGVQFGTVHAGPFFILPKAYWARLRHKIRQ